MTAQHTVLGEISPAISTEITAMKELGFDRDKAMFHLKIFRETQGMEELAEGLKAYYGYGSSLASRAVTRLSGSLTVQLMTTRLVQSYDPEKHRTFYEIQVINLVGREARLFDLDALQGMVNLISAQTQAPTAISTNAPRFVLLLG